MIKWGFLTSTTGDLIRFFTRFFYSGSLGSSAAAQRQYYCSLHQTWLEDPSKWMISSKTSRPPESPSQKVSWHMRASIIHNHYSLIWTLFTNINYISSATILNFIKQTNLLLDLFGSSTKKYPITEARPKRRSHPFPRRNSSGNILPGAIGREKRGLFPGGHLALKSLKTAIKPMVNLIMFLIQWL